MAQGPLDANSYEPGSFDVVVYTEVIEHISNQAEEFRRVWRLMRPGGLLFITCPNFNSLSRRMLGDSWNVIEYPEHLAYFTPKTLKTFMQNTGFKSVRLRTTGISITRLASGIRKNKPPDATAKIDLSKTGDERLRQVMEKRGMNLLKGFLNLILNTTRLGDAITASFVKDSDGK